MPQPTPDPLAELVAEQQAPQGAPQAPQGAPQAPPVAIPQIASTAATEAPTAAPTATPEAAPAIPQIVPTATTATPEAAPTAAPAIPPATMPTPPNALAQLVAAESNDKQTLQQVQGEHAVTQEQAGYAAQIAAQKPSEGWLGKAEGYGADMLKGAAAGVIHAAGELGSSAAGLILDGVSQAGMLQDAGEHTTDPQQRAQILAAAKGEQAITSAITNAPRELADDLAPTVTTAPGKVVQSIAQFVAPFMAGEGIADLGELSTVGKAIGSTVLGGLTQAAAFDPNDPRLSNLIQAHPDLRNPVTAFLASKPGDTEAEGRLKNGLEGIVTGGASEAVIGGFMSVLRGMRASGAIADTAKELVDAKPTAIPEVTPEVTPESHPAPEGTPQVTPQDAIGSTTGSTTEATSNSTGEPAATTQDATGNAAGSTTGAPEATEAPPAAEPVKPWVPDGIAKAASGDPVGVPAGATFDPEAVAKTAFSIPPEKAAAVLQALQEGRFNDVPTMLDDTHRTIPWDTLSDGANLKGLFNAVESNIGDLIKQAHGVGPVSSDAIVQLAKDIGGNVKSLQRTFGNVTSNGGLAAQITAAYNIMIASARRLQDLGEAAHALNHETVEGKQAIIDFQKQLELHAAIVGQVRQSSAEIARALYAHRALKASSQVALQNVSELMGTVLGPNAVKRYLKDVAGSEDLASVTKAVDKARGGRLMGVIREVAQNGMLSGPPTQLANLTGNVANMGIKLMERYLAGAIGSVRGVLMPNAEVASIRSAFAHSIGAYNGLRDSFPLMVKALAKEQDVSATGRPLVRAIERSTEGRNGLDLTLSQAINRAGVAIRYPGRTMGAIDNLNMGIGYQADLAARSYLQAAGEADAKGLTADARDSFMASRMAELRADPPADMKAKAWDAGLRQSFQEAAKTRLGEPFSKFMNAHPAVKLIFAPFVHRPMNMLRQSIMDYTALGPLLSATNRAALAEGNADTDVALARMLIGTGGIMTAYDLASNGKITGARDGWRNTQELDNVPKYSLNVGSRWYSYNRLDPVGLWLSIGADLHEMVNRYYDPQNQSTLQDLGTLARMGVQIIGSAAMDKSFMQSADRTFQMLGEKNPARAAVLGEQWVGSNARKFIPFSGALRSAAVAEDHTEREGYGEGLAGIWDNIKANLPGLSKELPPRRDVLGRPIINPAGDTAWWNPFAGVHAADDQMDRALSQIAANVEVPPRTLDGIPLDSQSYDQLLTLATHSPIFPGGTNLPGYLRQVTASPQWHQLGTTDDQGVTARTKLVQQVVDTAYDYGRQKYIESHPDFKAAMIQRQLAEAKHYAVHQ